MKISRCRAYAFCLATGLLWSCNEKKATQGEASASAVPSASAAKPALAAPIASGVPIDASLVERVVNPKREKVYSGPVGTVSGTVVATGDPPAPNSEKIPPECLQARETYRGAFREGMLRSLADVFIAVTGYEGYVPAKENARTIHAKGCAFDTRTIGLTFGQVLEVQSKDALAYVPELLGARPTAQLVATPGGPPVQLFAEKPGRYELVDSMRLYAKADVLVVKYATFDVTGLDGRFEIAGVPVGKAKLSALLPKTMGTVEQEVLVEEGKTTTVDVSIEFSKDKYAKLQAEREKSQ